MINKKDRDNVREASEHYRFYLAAAMLKGKQNSAARCPAGDVSTYESEPDWTIFPPPI